MITGQPQQTKDVLKKIQKNALSIDKKKDKALEKKFAQAKSLERSGLYEETFFLFKEINRNHPGINKYFQLISQTLGNLLDWI